MGRPMALRCALFVVLLAVTFAIALAGCPGGLDNPDRFFPCGVEGKPACTTTTSTVPTSTVAPLVDVFRPKCGVPGCHAPPVPQSDLDLFSAGLETRLIGRTSSSALCSGRTYIVSGNADQSLVWGKIAVTPSPCGGSMPPGLPLSAEEKDKIRSWIEGINP